MVLNKQGPLHGIPGLLRGFKFELFQSKATIWKIWALSSDSGPHFSKGPDCMKRFWRRTGWKMPLAGLQRTMAKLLFKKLTFKACYFTAKKRKPETNICIF